MTAVVRRTRKEISSRGCSLRKGLPPLLPPAALRAAHTPHRLVPQWMIVQPYIPQRQALPERITGPRRHSRVQRIPPAVVPIRVRESVGDHHSRHAPVDRWADTGRKRRRGRGCKAGLWARDRGPRRSCNCSCGVGCCGRGNHRGGRTGVGPGQSQWLAWLPFQVTGASGAYGSATSSQLTGTGGGAAPNSNAPASHPAPAGRGAPRWSVAGQSRLSAQSIAGLLPSSALVSVGPPLSKSAPSRGSTPVRSWAAFRPHA